MITLNTFCWIGHSFNYWGNYLWQVKHWSSHIPSSQFGASWQTNRIVVHWKESLWLELQKSRENIGLDVPKYTEMQRWVAEAAAAWRWTDHTLGVALGNTLHVFNNISNILGLTANVKAFTPSQEHLHHSPVPSNLCSLRWKFSLRLLRETCKSAWCLSDSYY